MRIEYRVQAGCVDLRKKFLILTVLYKTKSLDGTKPNTNPKTNPKSNTNPIQMFYAFFRAPSHDLQTS